MSEDPRPKRDKGRTGLCAGFLHNRRGSTAIEFAMLAFPFALLVFAILESCVSFAGQEVMANATDNVARQLRTGQVRAAAVTDTSLKQMICSQMQIIVAQNCPGLQVDLRQYATFAAAAAAGFSIDKNGVITLTGTSPTSFTAAPGPSESKNMLRVFYKWPVMTNFLAMAMSNMGTGYTLHFSSVTWQNEPFDD